MDERDLAECGWDLAECEWDLAECGWDLPESGWDLAECGWDLADCGWDLAECGWDLAESRWDLADCGWDLAEWGWDLAEWLERLVVNAKVATVLSWVPSQHPPTHGNLRGDRWSSVEKVHKKIRVLTQVSDYNIFDHWSIISVGGYSSQDTDALMKENGGVGRQNFLYMYYFFLSLCNIV